MQKYNEYNIFTEYKFESSVFSVKKWVKKNNGVPTKKVEEDKKIDEDLIKKMENINLKENKE